MGVSFRFITGVICYFPRSSPNLLRVSICILQIDRKPLHLSTENFWFHFGIFVYFFFCFHSSIFFPVSYIFINICIDLPSGIPPSADVHTRTSYMNQMPTSMSDLNNNREDPIYHRRTTQRNDDNQYDNRNWKMKCNLEYGLIRKHIL